MAEQLKITVMKFQSDILDVPVERPVINETTALGAAYLAGLAVGYWKTKMKLKNSGIWTNALNQQWKRKQAKSYMLMEKAIEATKAFK